MSALTQKQTDRQRMISNIPCVGMALLFALQAYLAGYALFFFDAELLGIGLFGMANTAALTAFCYILRAFTRELLDSIDRNRTIIEQNGEER